MKLRAKLALFASLLIITVVGGVSGVLFWYERQRIPADLEGQALGVTRAFAQVGVDAVEGNDDIMAVNYLNVVLKKREDVVRAFFAKADGTVVADTDFKMIGEKLSGALAGSLARSESSEAVIFQMPALSRKGESLGMVQVGFSRSHWNRLIAEQLSRTGRRVASVALIALVIGITGAWLFALVMAKPIQRLVEGAKAVGSGNLEYRIEAQGKDELADLAKEFNEMGRKLQEVDEMKSAFVSSVSHELRSPLTAIKGYVEQMLKGRAGTLNDEQKEYLTIVKNNTARLGGFINDILDLAKIEARQMDLKLEPVPVKAIADEIVTLFKFQAEEKSVTLTSKVSEALPAARADQDKLRQVFTNLINNALKFTPESGSVTVSAEPKNGEIVCHIADTGLGIPPEDQPFIFDKFRQSRSVQERAKKAKGTGLGLAIVKGIVEGHGGKIWLTSQVDKGTTFSFTLPAMKGQG